MRLIGNKTRLLGDIEALVRERGVRGGTFVDVFSGTAGVGRHFKALGFRVLANDRMSMCYTQAVARVEVNDYPRFAALRDKLRSVLASRAFRSGAVKQVRFPFEDAPGSSDRKLPPGARYLHEVVRLLNVHVEPLDGIVFQNYCPGGRRGRMYFTDETGRKIDGCLAFLRHHFREGRLSDQELHLLLAAVIDAADRVANISGTYGAYLKRFQSNAKKSFTIRVPEVVRGAKGCRAYQLDGNEFVRSVNADVLYIDPPYNRRQYAANYHVLEILAEHHRIDDLDAYEANLYGKTGLRPYSDLRSAFCVPVGSRRSPRDVLSAMSDLILAARAKHIVISYNEEGLLTSEQIGGLLAAFSGKATYEFREDMRVVRYQRFRSDSDRSLSGPRGRRRYKVLDGKEPDEVSDWLFVASRGRQGARATGGRRLTRNP